MRIPSRRLSLCLAALVAVVSGLAVADVVILNPAEMKGQVSFGSETLTQFKVRAYSQDGFQAEKLFTANPYSLTVESGHAYRPTVQAFFSNATAAETYLEVTQNNAVMVDNQSGPTTVNFNHANASRVNFSLNVVGGTVSYYYVYASAGTPTESTYARTYKSFSTPQPASASSWVSALPDDAVTVYGNVYLTTPGGTQVQRSLTQQTVNLLQGPASVSWQIDLTNTGQLSGQVGISPGTAVTYHYVYFQGVSSTPTSGISGSKYITANSPYSIDLPPGTYDVFLRTYFQQGTQYTVTKSSRVTIAAGATSTLDFIETQGAGQVPLTVSGFYSNADISSFQLGVMRKDPSPGLTNYGYDYRLQNGRFEPLLSPGTWQRSNLYLSLYNASNPAVPLNASVQRTYYADSSVPVVAVAPGATVSLGAENVTLVKTTAYFDVQESSPEAAEIPLSSPYARLSRFAFNSDNSYKSYHYAYGAGSNESRALSALTLVAEPGTYSMQAFATVNGSVTQFSNQNITFAAPAQTPEGVDVTVTPVETEELKVNVTFPLVTDPGVTTVVETPLAPEPPKGIQLFCADGASAEGIECSPLYYDIETTAEFESATVCVRRKFKGANGLAFFLRLFHFNKNTPPTGAWEELPAPPDMEPAIDCADNLAACGCTSLEDCGIDYSSDPPVSVIQVCGVTTGFSPFAVGAVKEEFTNTVNGVEYTGPTGPPSLQTWTVPETGTYKLTAIGASGASATQAQAQQIQPGCGAELRGTFDLQQGDTLQILVGQKGTAATYSGGGGGGTFVLRNGSPLLIAGGGGGVRAGATVPGRHGSTGADGVAGSVSANYTSGFVAGGTGGLGGSRSASYGAGGGGWTGNGAVDGAYGEGGTALRDGGKGGTAKTCGGLAHGGYGGGGAGNGCYGGGGGGGYSGGGGGRVGGGGGSLNTSLKPESLEGTCTPNGHGRVTVSIVTG
ncbi:endo-1,C4-beta-glucanase [Corallococcus exercitus]|uniref:endo-1,C4-beta-glucanase n=1 Tax=Corallococcus exercitus TaxID=2316736 RepID=UPI0035D5125F